MREMILQTLEHWFGNAYALIVLVGSAIPVTEMRATIPLGILVWNMNPWYVMFLGFLGALLPVPLLLLFFEEIMILMHKIPASKKLALWIDEKVQKNARQFEKSTELALIIFVAIPLPGTGLWTGSMVASVLGFKFWRSLICVGLGGVLSAIIMTVVSVFFSSMFSLL